MRDLPFKVLLGMDILNDLGLKMNFQVPLSNGKILTREISIPTYREIMLKDSKNIITTNSCFYGSVNSAEESFIPPNSKKTIAINFENLTTVAHAICYLERDNNTAHGIVLHDTVVEIINGKGN